MIQTVSTISLVLLAISLVFCAYRAITGPTMPDRVIAVDTIGTIFISIIGVFSIKLNQPHYFDSALIIAILSFSGTVALGKFLIKGECFDRDID
ncbi:MAG: multicomponent Na+:H+ antiporter subunit [Thermosediminibacterales bacterium]|nr:multicomponent Na+:H+ antiporter subunit [Thermosediminibacterales bacterium]MDK2836261.1 multicomponent Na+:H+ antiporter subunit [Thermosediminibacterales bacterium]